MGTRVLARVIAVTMLVAGTIAGCAMPQPRTPDERTHSKADRLTTLPGPGQPGWPLYFEQNGGQVDARVAFLARTPGMVTFFADDGPTMVLQQAIGASGSGSDRLRRRETADAVPSSRRQWALKRELVGGRPVRPVGESKLDTVVSYFRGPAEAWVTGQSTYTEVVYPDVWPGIDVVYGRDDGRMKVSYSLTAGADAGSVIVRYRGVTDATIDPAGALLLETPLGPVRESPPVAWQTIGGQRVTVEARFELQRQPGDDAAESRFVLGPYDPTVDLVIDPTFEYGTFIGGNGSDVVQDIAIEPGCLSACPVYMIGSTSSAETSFPDGDGVGAIPGFDGAYASVPGFGDAFVARLRADGTSLSYVAYLGGTQDELGLGIAADDAGFAYLAGATHSSAAQGFPATVGPDLTKNGTGTDGFVAKVAAKWHQSGLRRVHRGVARSVRTGHRDSAGLRLQLHGVRRRGAARPDEHVP